MRPFLAVLALLSVLLLGACGPAHESVLGTMPVGDSQPAVLRVAETRNASVSQMITLRGMMVEKCPVAGCWFRIQDDTGTIKVDTKAAGFAVSEIPLRSSLTVSGTITLEGNEILIAATGLRY